MRPLPEQERLSCEDNPEAFTPAGSPGRPGRGGFSGWRELYYGFVVTNPPIPPAPPGSPIVPSPELERMLAFISEENGRHRAYFSTLFTVTASVLGLIVAVAGGVAVYFGYNTADSARQVASVQATTAVNKKIDELSPDIQSRITKEFETPRIEKIVREEAQSATATTAKQVIREEVENKVSSAVDAEQDGIKRTMNVAADKAVDEVKGDIQKEANKAVTRIVDVKISPELRRLRSFSDLSSAIALARAGDGKGLDSLVAMANDDKSSPELQHAAKATVESVTLEMTYGPNLASSAGCNDGQSHLKPLQGVSVYEAQLASESVDERRNAANCLGRAGDLFASGQTRQDIKASMDSLFQSMSNDPDLIVRKSAFWSFVGLAGWVYPQESIMAKLRMFDNSANSKWWKANRDRFVK